MSNYGENFPDLKNMLGGYFHNFWPEECRKAGKVASTQTVVQMFIELHVEEIQKQYLIELVQELEEFLDITSGLDEKKLKKIVFYDLAANIDPSASGLTYRQWLEEVLGMLKKGVAEWGR
jgi:CdiI immunity protein